MFTSNLVLLFTSLRCGGLVLLRSARQVSTPECRAGLLALDLLSWCDVGFGLRKSTLVSSRLVGGGSRSRISCRQNDGLIRWLVSRDNKISFRRDDSLIRWLVSGGSSLGRRRNKGSAPWLVGTPRNEKLQQ